MSKAWVRQKTDEIQQLGEDKAPWYVGWYDPEGHRRQKCCGPGVQGKKIADKEASKITAQLMTGTYDLKTNVTWETFVAEYTRRVLDGLSPRSKDEALTGLAHFQRITKVSRILLVCTATVDDFIAARRKERGKKKGENVSPATINKDLRHLKAAMNAAVDWGYLTKAPKFRMEKVPKKLVRYVSGEDYTAIYHACDQARLPRDLPYEAADWWRGLISFIYMTGWRIGDMLALRRDAIDFNTGHALSCHEDNKGGRDDKVKLHEVVLDHLSRIKAFDAMMFPWPHDRRTLDEEWDRIQTAAGIKLTCHRRHEHTPACHLYGFHDLRRAFATMNADRLTPDALQALMRHKSYLTTQVYINMSRQIDEVVNLLHVPDVLKGKHPDQRKDNA